MGRYSLQPQVAIDHRVGDVASDHSFGHTQARGYLVLRDTLESMVFQHALTLDRQFLQIAEKLVGLLAR